MKLKTGVLGGEDLNIRKNYNYSVYNVCHVIFIVMVFYTPLEKRSERCELEMS